MSKTIGYCRISTAEQSNDRQILDIQEFCEKNRIENVNYKTEQISSKKKLEDREIYKIINEMKKDDILIVTELSRIARSMSEINEITSIAIRKGIIIRVISGDRIIDNSIQSQSLTFAIGMSAQIERDLISERTKSALKEAKNRGVKMGRPKKSGIKLEGREKEIKEMLKNGASKSYIARALSVNRITVDKFIKDNALNEKLIKEMTKNKIKQ